MPINLSKGQKISLSKEAPGLKKIMVGLGWDTNKYDGGQDFDLDASAFLAGANGKCTSDVCNSGKHRKSCFHGYHL